MYSIFLKFWIIILISDKNICLILHVGTFFSPDHRRGEQWIIRNCIYCSWMKYPQVSIKGCLTQKHYIPFDLFWNLKLRSCDTALDSSQYSTCWLCLSKTWFMNNLDECYLTSLTSLLCLWSVDKLKLHNHYTYP
jgi:hypothetical protein